MMEVATLAGGALLSTTFELLLSKLNSSVSEWLNLPKKVRVEMQNWRCFLPKISAVHEDAEEKQLRDRIVKLWLVDLTDLVYDMEDVLEEVEIDAMRSKLFAKAQASTSKYRKLRISKLFNRVARFMAERDRKMASKVEDITSRLRLIDANINTLGLISLTMRTGDMCRKVAAERLLTSSLPEHHVYGRESDKETILQMLLDDEGKEESYSVIPIVGMGGIGKTTLARLIYNDEKLKGSFRLKAWVCVSEDFDVNRLTRAILEQVSRENYDSKELTPLQERLKEKLSGQKFLIVLDDIWNECYELWDNLQRPFLSGAPGSKIIITTRMENVGLMMRGNNTIYRLPLLKDDACLSLFARHALGTENFDSYPDLKGVGEKIVVKCKRLPLAIKTLSGLLRGELHHNRWENILNSEIWDLPESSCGILPALRLSYNHLPSHLKRCFGYCSIFPKDYEFDEGDLVLLWMAEGLLQQRPQRIQQMKELGHQYFQDLLLRAFFQRSSTNKSLFVMHDLMVDLALHVSKGIGYTLELEGKISSVKACHLSLFPCQYEVSKRFEFLKEKTNLRTFLQLKSKEDYNIVNVNYMENYLSETLLEDMMKSLTCLRVLSLQKYAITKLPDSIGGLKHLRYIDLSGTGIKSLPESVGYLLYLQTLLLRGCEELSKLPTTIGNLLDLQHLDIVETPSLKEIPSEISNLTNLVTLSKFIVGNVRGPRVKDLKNLSDLRGQLSILDLHNVLDASDAKEANLYEIEGLDDLSLEWSSKFHKNRNESCEMHVLSWLKPHQGLKRLTIKCFGGLTLPPWIGDPSFSNLKFLEFCYCQRSSSLPSLGQLPLLKELIITGMHALVTLEFDGENSSTALAFPTLDSLYLQDCPMLVGKLPKYLPSLKNFKIAKCPKLMYSPVTLPSLEELYMEECSEVVLRSMVDLTSLKKLSIYDCEALESLPVETMMMERLEELKIRRCHALKVFPSGKLPTMLKVLNIEECEKLESLPKGIWLNNDDGCQVSHLEELKIISCPCLKPFPSGSNCLPNSLKWLYIKDCKQLESLPQRMLQNCSELGEINISHGGVNMKSLSLEDMQGPTSLVIENCDDLESLWLSIPNLKFLTISSCRNLKSLPGGGLPPNLTDLSICECPGIKSMPDDGLPPNLTYLSICECPGIKSMPDDGLPPNLQSLVIRSCPGIESIQDGVLPPTLTFLEIWGCPGIESVPDGVFPPNLTDLRIDCKNLKQPPMQEWGLSSLTSLLFFHISWICPPDNVLPTSLTTLEVRNIEDMKSISRGLLQNLNSLQELTIKNWGKLQSLPKEVLPPSLQSLTIWDCPNLLSLPKGGLPPSLKELDIQNCPKLQSLPKEGLPPSLERLWIGLCPLLERRCLKEKGDYWPLIARIPNIGILDDSDDDSHSHSDSSSKDDESDSECSSKAELCSCYNI